MVERGRREAEGTRTRGESYNNKMFTLKRRQGRGRRRQLGEKGSTIPQGHDRFVPRDLRSMTRTSESRSKTSDLRLAYCTPNRA